MSDLINTSDIWESEPIRIKKRSGSSNDPYISITEELTVNQNLVYLKEIPDKYSRVVVMDGSTKYSEMDSRSKVKGTNMY